MRTSSMLALTGVLVAQLTLLQQQDSGFGYSRVGKPLAVCCYASAIWTVLSGACRVWRYQQALIRGQALTGGFELASITMVFLALLAVFFGFTVAIDTPGHPSRTT
ncbi:hypothetical protein F5Y04DRAFT_250265 [Hypomontagnella monticulosa]|nr:hypothetical protein F5Y04DRAFT_250265 [Hypomontagnella monticulosa]